MGWLVVGLLAAALPVSYMAGRLHEASRFRKVLGGVRPSTIELGGSYDGEY